MPRKQRVELLDDIAYGQDGAEVEATEERTFIVGGQQFHTYLSAAHAKEFDADMLKWTEFAEKVPTTKARKQSHSTTGGSGGGGTRRGQDQSSRIRKWAIAQSFHPPISDRGRIPDKASEAYFAAHPEEERIVS